jgi:hypothetical protein
MGFENAPIPHRFHTDFTPISHRFCTDFAPILGSDQAGGTAGEGGFGRDGRKGEFEGSGGENQLSK